MEEGIVEALTKRAVGSKFVGASDYRTAHAAIEALVSETSFRTVGNAIRGDASARRTLATSMDARLPTVRKALEADSNFTNHLVSGIRRHSRGSARQVSSLLNERASAWDVLTGLFEADIHSWSADASRWYQEGLDSGMAKDMAIDYGAAMAQARPYLELAAFLAGGNARFLDEYRERLRRMATP
jgi:hypothetical protein